MAAVLKKLAGFKKPLTLRERTILKSILGKVVGKMVDDKLFLGMDSEK